MTLLISGFAAFFVVQLIKILVTPKLQGEGLGKALTKMVLAGGASFGAAVLTLPVGDWRACVAYGVAGAGLAVLLHKTTRLISNAGDLSYKRFMDSFRGM